MYGPETGMSLGNKKTTNPINQANQNPALGSLKQFGRQINDNIIQPTANALNYANPVTFTRNLWDAAGQLPQTIREFDARRGREMRADLRATEAKNKQFAQMNNPSTKDFGVKATPQLTPESYAQSNRPLPAGVVDHPGTQNAQSQARLGNKQSPYTNIQVTPSNWKTPGARYNEMDKSQLLDENGYPSYVDGEQVTAPVFDNTYMQKRYGEEVYRPRTEEQRFAEGAAAQSMRERFLRNSNNGNYRPKPIQQPDPAHDIAMRRLGLDIEKFNDSLNPVYEPRFTKIYDDLGVVTGEEYAGNFDAQTGRFTPAKTNSVFDSIPAMQQERVIDLVEKADTDEKLTRLANLLVQMGFSETDLRIILGGQF